jgi:hypothetical protein
LFTLHMSIMVPTYGAPLGIIKDNKTQVHLLFSL